MDYSRTEERTAKGEKEEKRGREGENTLRKGITHMSIKRNAAESAALSTQHYHWRGDVVRRMTKIPSEWPEKMASTKISWSDNVGLLESAGEACILERADPLVIGVCDRP